MDGAVRNSLQLSAVGRYRLFYGAALGAQRRFFEAAHGTLVAALGGAERSAPRTKIV